MPDSQVGVVDKLEDKFLKLLDLHIDELECSIRWCTRTEDVMIDMVKDLIIPLSGCLNIFLKVFHLENNSHIEFKFLLLCEQASAFGRLREPAVASVDVACKMWHARCGMQVRPPAVPDHSRGKTLDCHTY